MKHPDKTYSEYFTPIVRILRTARPLTSDCPSGYFGLPVRLLLTLLLLTASVSETWGQSSTDRSGIYYFVNCGSGKSGDSKIEDITNPDNYYYLVPADNPQQDNKRDAWFSSDYSEANGDPEKPYLTTYRTKKDAADVPTGVTNRPHNSVWIVKFASTDSGTDYYYLIHAATGKYVVYEPPYSTRNNRKSVHLLTTDSPGENAKFAITTADPTRSDCFNIRVKNLNSGNRFLNPTYANYNYYYSSDSWKDGDADYLRGLVGLYLNKKNDKKDDASASDWKPEATLLDAPTISDVDANGKVTIADANSLPLGYEIRYTTDSTTPTASTGTVYSDAISITATVTIKAVVVRYGMVLTEVASEVREPAPCATPVFDYNNTTSKVSITSTTPNCTIYYTTDGSTPTTSSTPYNGPFSIDSQTTVIQAIATKSGFRNSETTSIKVVLTSTITLAENEYTYDGSEKQPTVSSVMDGDAPISNTEYAVSYSNNTNAGTATVNIKDKPGGEYIISGSTTFTINPAGVTLTANSGTEAYDGTEKTLSGFTCSVGGLTFEGVSASGSGTNIGNYPVTFTGVTIGTTKDATGNYVVTSTVNGTLTISRKQLTITADSETKVYDGTPLTKGTYTNTELLTGDQIESVTVTGSQTDAGTSDNVPSAVIIKNSNDDDVTANYDITYTNGTLTVNPKEVGITWGETTTFVYDANSHAPSATITGLLNGDEVSADITGQQTNVGDDYTATVSGLTGDKAGNYSLTTTYTKNFSITPAALTITAKDRTISYGDEPSNWGVDYEGFKGDDNEEVLTGTLAYAYDYEQYDEPGNYTITPSGLTSTNYNITYQTGTLTVKKRTIVLKWTNTSFTYDGEAHLPTATATGMVNGEEIGVTVSGSQTNAGKYSATASGLTGEKAGHYELPAFNTESFTISPKSLGDGDLPAEGITIQLTSDGELDYVKDGDITLTTDEDYTYDIQHEGSDQIVAVSGTGNYTGSLRGIYAHPQFYDVDGEGAGKAAAVYMSSRDVNNFAGVNAYTVKSVNTYLGLITVNKLKYIPKGVPVLLLSDSEASGFVVTEKDEDIADVSNDTINSNLLKMAPAEGVVVENAQVYMFYKGEFVLTKAGTITEGKFYLNNPSYTDNPADPAPVPARGTLMIVEEETTGMDDALHFMNNKQLNNNWYDLQGRKIESHKLTKGLYIHNGRKVIVK